MFICIFSGKKYVHVLLKLELFCLLTKKYDYSVLSLFGSHAYIWEKKDKIIIFSHKIFINEFPQHISVECGLHDVAN